MKTLKRKPEALQTSSWTADCPGDIAEIADRVHDWLPLFCRRRVTFFCGILYFECTPNDCRMTERKLYMANLNKGVPCMQSNRNPHRSSAGKMAIHFARPCFAFCQAGARWLLFAALCWLRGLAQLRPGSLPGECSNLQVFPTEWGTKSRYKDHCWDALS